MNNYRVSIAVPVYGVELYVEKCAKSLFEQTYSNLEILFIDDCSLDKSVEIINKTLEQYPDRKDQVRIVKQSKNKGCPAARNLAVQHASGEFIFHVDADDYIDPDAIAILVDEQQSTGADLIVGNYLIETQNATKLVQYCDITKSKEEIVIDCLDDKSSQSVWGILIKRSLYIDNNIKANESFHVGEDWQVSPLLLYHAKKIAYVDKVIYHYQLSRPNSITITSQASVTKKKNQLICFVKTMNCLLESFKDKGQAYLDVIYRKKAILVQDAMIYCCKDRDKEYFKYLVLELKSIDQKYLSVLGDHNPLILSMKKNYYMLSLILYINRIKELMK